MRERRFIEAFTAPLLALAWLLADTPTALARPDDPDAATIAREQPREAPLGSLPLATEPLDAWVSPARPGTDEIVTEVPVEPREPPTSPVTAQDTAGPFITQFALPVEETVQIAAEKPRRPRRPPLPPGKRELRQARGLLAGGIILATLCSAGFGVITYALIAGRDRFTDRSRGGAYTMLGATFSCTLVSAAGIGVGARKLRSLKGRVAWTGGLGLQF